MFEEHVGEVLEKLWILWAEESTCDLVHHLLQLRVPLVVRHRVIADEGQMEGRFRTYFIIIQTESN